MKLPRVAILVFLFAVLLLVVPFWISISSIQNVVSRREEAFRGYEETGGKTNPTKGRNEKKSEGNAKTDDKAWLPFPFLKRANARGPSSTLPQSTTLGPSSTLPQSTALVPATPSADATPPDAFSELNYTYYYPRTMSTLLNYYRSQIKPDSLDMLKSPSEYRAMSCPALRVQHQREYERVVSRVDLSAPPPYSLYGYYSDPYPLCGRYLLSHLYASNALQYVYALRAPTAALPRTTEMKSAVRGATRKPDVAVVNAVAGVRNEDIFVEQCGTCADDKNSSEQSCGADILLMARLFSSNRVVNVDVLPLSKQNDTNTLAHPLSFLAFEPGLYVLEVRVVHVNGSSRNSDDLMTLGIVGSRATVRGAKSFLYNAVCDVQRLVSGSPIRVVVHASCSASGAACKDNGADGISKVEKRQPSAKALVPYTSEERPFCNVSVNYNTREGGQWVRFFPDPDLPDGGKIPENLVIGESALDGSSFVEAPRANCSDVNDPYCYGRTEWLTDARGYNFELVWAPTTCKLHVFRRWPDGPDRRCFHEPALRNKLAPLLVIGDSIAREYMRGCEMLNLGTRGARCVQANIVLEGHLFTPQAGASFVRSMMDSITLSNGVGALVTNMGMQHFTGRGSVEAWAEYLDIFVQAWVAANITVLFDLEKVNAAPGASFAAPNCMVADPDCVSGSKDKYILQMEYTFRALTLSGALNTNSTLSPEALQKFRADQEKRREILRSVTEEEAKSRIPGIGQYIGKAIWIGSSTLHYARSGMSYQRTLLFDRIAYAKLQPLGFFWMDAMTPTRARQEASWDGLHYCSETGKVQSPHRNPYVRGEAWNGGVSSMLFLVLINIICYS